MSFSFFLRGRMDVRCGGEIGLLSLQLMGFWDVSLEDCPLAPACLIEKVTLWECHLYLTSGSETNEGVEETKFWL